MINSIMGMTPVVFWLVVTIVLAVFEIITLGLSTIWFAFGALFACFGAMLGVGIIPQIVIFVLVSVLSLLLVRPLSVKYFNNRVSRTNIDALVGRKVIVSGNVDNLKGTGLAAVDGTTWNVRTDNDNEKILDGETVVIKRVDGNKLIVEKERQF